MPLTPSYARAAGRAAILHRCELLLGMGGAALGGCAPKLRAPAVPAASDFARVLREVRG